MTITNFYIIYKFLRLKFWGFISIWIGLTQFFTLYRMCQQSNLITKGRSSPLSIMVNEYPMVFAEVVVFIGIGVLLSISGTQKIEKCCEEEAYEELREKKQLMLERKKRSGQEPEMPIEKEKIMKPHSKLKQPKE